MTVVNSTFKNTGGTAPQAGIDIEPNANDTVNNVQIKSSRFLNNKGLGVLITIGDRAPNAFARNVTVESNLVVGNHGGIGLYHTSGHHIIENNIRDNDGFGIQLDQKTKENSLVGNQVVGRNGILDKGANTLSRNKTE